jgi:hypothetical protein
MFIFQRLKALVAEPNRLENRLYLVNVTMPLAAFLMPDLSPPERTLAQVEGWILGVPGLIRQPVQFLCNRA